MVPLSFHFGDAMPCARGGGKSAGRMSMEWTGMGPFQGDERMETHAVVYEDVDAATEPLCGSFHHVADGVDVAQVADATTEAISVGGEVVVTCPGELGLVNVEDEDAMVELEKVAGQAAADAFGAAGDEDGFVGHWDCWLWAHKHVSTECWLVVVCKDTSVSAEEDCLRIGVSVDLGVGCWLRPD